MKAAFRLSRLICVMLMLALIPAFCAQAESADGGDAEWFTFFLMCNEGNINERGDVGNTIMVFSVNPVEGRIKQAIIRWDVFYEDPDTSELQLFDQPFREGGVEKAMETFNRLFDQNISSYLSINYLNLAYLLDEYGGVYVDLSRAERNAINGLLDDKVHHLETQMMDLGLDATSFQELVEAYYLNEYGPNTHLNGIQAVAYGWLQYDSVEECCLREVDVISQFFFQVSKFVLDRTFIYTGETIASLESADPLLRPVNLDALTEEDRQYLYDMAAPIFTRAYSNLSEDEVVDWLVAILRTMHNGSLSGKAPFDVVEFRMIPESNTHPYEQIVDGTRGLVIDYEQNAQILDDFLFDRGDASANMLIEHRDPDNQ